MLGFSRLLLRQLRGGLMGCLPTCLRMVCGGLPLRATVRRNVRVARTPLCWIEAEKWDVVCACPAFRVRVAVRFHVS